MSSAEHARAHQAPLRLLRYKETRLRNRVEYAVMLLRWARAWLDETHDMSLQAALDGLAHAKRVRRTARSLEGLFEDAATAIMLQQNVTHYEGDGYTATLRPGQQRKEWQDEKIMAEVVEGAVARAQRRFPDLPAKQVRVMVSESLWGMYDLARQEWRSTALRSRGIDPNEFSTLVPAEASVDLRGEASYTSQPVPARPGRPRPLARS